MSRNGKNRGGRHLKQNLAKSSRTAPSNNPPSAKKKPQNVNGKKKWSTKKKVGVILGTTAAIFALTIGMVAFATDWLRGAREEMPDVRLEPTGPRAPVIDLNPNPESNTPETNEVENVEELGEQSLRNTDMFTFLVLGLDPIGANTDVIMVGAFDSVENTFNIVNIPRDTMANVSWNLRKVNSIYANMRIRYRDEDDAELRAMEATVEAFRDILGFKVDYWVVVSHRALPTLIDAIGGVDFNVPVTMYHSGVTLQRGQRRLTGAQALHVLRFRGFASADIGRINTTQNFLTAAAQQIIERRDSIRVTDLANLFLNNVITDIPLTNLVWFGERFLQIDPDNITFHTMPGQLDGIHGGSFISILLPEWLELINTHISPWHFDITQDTVSILTRGPDRRLFVTDGNWQGNPQWGAGTLGPRTINNIADFAPPRAGAGGGGGGGGGGTADRPEEPQLPEVCPDCNNPFDACTRCFVCGNHDCICAEPPAPPPPPPPPPGGGEPDEGDDGDGESGGDDTGGDD